MYTLLLWTSHIELTTPVMKLGFHYPGNLYEFCPLQYLHAPSPTLSAGGLVQ